LPASSAPQLPINWVGARSHTDTISRNSALLRLAALLHSVFCKKNVPKYLNFANFLKNYFLYRTAQEGESRNNASAILIYSYVLREVLT
jgi:hypothetical protein